jgi:hypothetical protein
MNSTLEVSEEHFLTSSDGYRYRVYKDPDELVFFEYQEWNSEKKMYEKIDSFKIPEAHIKQFAQLLYSKFAFPK